ncbi:MAG: thioredoxin [Gammaproteobacteria bacterium]|nr:MAG: thioredoxin [Gammaproteobacteria bacterium]
MRWTILAWLALFMTAAGAVETRNPETHFFNQTFGDFSEELENAREQGKKGILIMFEMEECPFCHRMKQRVLNRKDVQDYFREHFLIFSVDIEGDIEITDFKGNPTTMKDFAFRQFRVRATPVFQFFDLEGKPIRRGRYTGATRDAEEFLLLGRYIVEEAYRKTSFTRYKRSQRKR